MREILFKEYSLRISKKNIIHLTSYLHSSVILGFGTIIFPRSTVNALSSIANNCIINTGSVIEHEVSIGENSHISVGSVLCGRVEIGKNCFVGAGAIVRDSIKICDNVVLGAGAVVVKDIVKPGVYIGTPAKKMR
jgi:sugar O-acyltransferase (sialic acid O-acetyltransferase NeuD family)